MARILLAASDPAIELLLERFGHEVLILDPSADTWEQLGGVDIVLPALDPLGQPRWPDTLKEAHQRRGRPQLAGTREHVALQH